MWEKKVYPLDKSKKKTKGPRKQRHHAVSSNKLLVPDKCGTSCLRTHWSKLDYGSSSWMLNQLMNELDDDYDNDFNGDCADGDVAGMGYVDPEVGGVETHLMQGLVYDLNLADRGCHGDGMGSADYEVEENETDILVGVCENEEQDEAKMMGYDIVDFEMMVGSDDEDEWILIGG